MSYWSMQQPVTLEKAFQHDTLLQPHGHFAKWHDADWRQQILHSPYNLDWIDPGIKWRRVFSVHYAL